MGKFRTASTMIQEWEKASKRIQTEADIRAEVKSDIAKECKYLLACGMGKKKSLEHLIKILEKGQEYDKAKRNS